MDHQVSCYSWGKNKDGELSVGLTRDIFRPEPLKGMRSKQLVYISSGGQHSACIDSEGQLYICGSYLHGKLGIEDISTITIITFKPMKFFQSMRVKQVACGDYHTLCLTDDGQVYTWGGNLHKKLGQRPNSGKGTSKPGLVTQLKDKRIISVSCGDFHSRALGSDGKLYSWGGGGSQYNKGQCGLGITNDTDEPTWIRSLKGKDIVKVTCGGYHTLALSSANELLSWGSGLHGELGTGEFLSSPSPKVVIFPWVKSPNEETKEILAISAGGHHSVVLLTSGEVFTFGFASHGQLGLRSVKNYCEPQLVADLKGKKVVEGAAGWNHSIVLTNEGDVWTCGYGFCGQLGLGDDEPRTAFTHVSALGNLKACKVFAGGNHSWAVVNLKDPIRENYSPPSPLLDDDDDDKRDLMISYEPKQQKSEFELTLVYMNNEYCHRFIYFVLKEASLNIGIARVNEYAEEMYYIETGIQSHVIQEDDLILETDENGKEISHAANKCAFSCLLVCDPARNTPPIHFTKEFEEELVVKKQSYELEGNNVETALSEWVRYFMLKVGNFCKVPPVFMELRPGRFSN